ncbi:hypothetical protein ZHS_83 [Edwardsiella phage vB_EpM_ZHS]|jgi:hypothetical protein|nr:hypothetical protein ZHS_83 [Edwardsiella phage vB_EpM_ZHS]
MSGKHEPGAVCIIVAEGRGFEENIGALVTLTRFSRCACGCGAEGWEWQDASRPILISRHVFFRSMDHRVSASQDVQNIPGWPSHMMPKHPAAWLLPVKGDETGCDLWRETPLLHEKEELKSLPGFARAWNCRCTQRPVQP